METLNSLRDDICQHPKLARFDVRIRVGYSIALVKQPDFIAKVARFIDFYETKERNPALFLPVGQKIMNSVNEALEDGTIPQDAAKFVIFHKEEIREVLRDIEQEKKEVENHTSKGILLKVLSAVVEALNIVDAPAS